MKRFLSLLFLFGATVLFVPSVWAQEADCLYPAVTLVAQKSESSVILQGTPVCVLYVVKGGAIKVTTDLGVEFIPLVAVRAPVAGATGPRGGGINGVGIQETYFYESQLKGR